MRLIVPAGGELLPAVRGVAVRVPASSTIRASRRVVGAGTRVTFSGRIRRAGQPLPPRGLVVVLQGRTGGVWQTFADTRTTRAGRWKASYRFRGRPGTLPGAAADPPRQHVPVRARLLADDDRPRPLRTHRVSTRSRGRLSSMHRRLIPFVLVLAAGALVATAATAAPKQKTAASARSWPPSSAPSSTSPPTTCRPR